MIPSPEAVEDYLVNLCLALHDAGWGQPNKLIPVLAEPDGSVRAVMIPLSIPIDVRAATWIQQIAANAAWDSNSTAVALFAKVCTANLAGWMAVTETWNWGGTDEEYAELPPGTSIAGHRLAYESRMLVLHDVGDTAHMVYLPQGERTPTYARGQADRDVSVEGALVDGLRLLTIASARWMPPGTHRMPALLEAPETRPIDFDAMLKLMPPLAAGPA